MASIADHSQFGLGISKLVGWLLMIFDTEVRGNRLKIVHAAVPWSHKTLTANSSWGKTGRGEFPIQSLERVGNETISPIPKFFPQLIHGVI